jgi:hypothetical protein
MAQNRQASIAGCSEQDETDRQTPSTSVKFEDLPDLMRNYQLLRKHIR